MRQRHAVWFCLTVLPCLWPCIVLNMTTSTYTNDTDRILQPIFSPEFGSQVCCLAQNGNFITKFINRRDQFMADFRLSFRVL